MSTGRKIYLPALALFAVLSFGAPVVAQDQDNDERERQQQERDANRDDQDRDDRDREDRGRDDRERQQQQQDLRNRQRQADQDDSRGALGVYISDARSGGVEIERVIQGSPADQAGLREGDRILRVNGQSVNSPQTLSRAIAQQDPGSQVKIDLIRNGQRRNLEVRLVSRQQAIPKRGRRTAEMDRAGRERWNSRRPYSDYRQTTRGDHNGRQTEYGDRNGFDQRFSRLENMVERLSRQVDRLQGRLDGRTGGRDYRSRGTQYEDDQQTNRFPLQDRYDSDFDRDLHSDGR